MWSGEGVEGRPTPQGIEDALGYMDFKMAGTAKGMTSLQVQGRWQGDGDVCVGGDMYVGDNVCVGGVMWYVWEGVEPLDHLLLYRWTSNRYQGYLTVSSRML